METLLEVAQTALLAYLGWRVLQKPEKPEAPEAPVRPQERPYVKGEGRQRLRAYLEAKQARRASE